MTSTVSPRKEGAPLSTQGYRGTRDFFPEDQRMRQFIRQKIHQVLQSYGYEEYDGPIVEHLDLYAAKSSEEIVRDQLYSFTDRGERNLAIRPEMTPTLARMVASRNRELPKPIRWYSIPTCMRFERPQRGRLREFDQLNVDVFGGLPVDEDVEILCTCIDLLASFGAQPSDFEIRINHRAVVNTFLYQILGVNQNLGAPLLRLLDKKDKMTAEAFYEAGTQLNLTATQLSTLDNFLQSSIDEAISLLQDRTPAVYEIKERMDLVKSLFPMAQVIFSPQIMRGFDYYTGMVLEAFDTHPDNRRALFGGGRYDNLVGAFGGEELPGIGYGMGDVAITNFMETHGLTPQLTKQVDVSVLRFGEQDRATALALAQSLRTAGLRVETTLTATKFGKQIQAASKQGAQTVAFRGDEDFQKNEFSVKFLRDGSQKSYAFCASGFEQFAKEIRRV